MDYQTVILVLAGWAKKIEGNDVCCWVCINCLDHELPADDKCIACPNGTFPDKAKTQCNLIPVDYMSMDSPWAVIATVFAGTGVLAVIFIFCVFIKYNNTPVIMASGRELCYVLMIGMIMCFFMT